MVVYCHLSNSSGQPRNKAVFTCSFLKSRTIQQGVPTAFTLRRWVLNCLSGDTRANSSTVTRQSNDYQFISQDLISTSFAYRGKQRLYSVPKHFCPEQWVRFRRWFGATELIMERVNSFGAIAKKKPALFNCAN